MNLSDPQTMQEIIIAVLASIIILVITGIWKKIWNWISIKCKQAKETRKVKKLNKKMKEKRDMFDKQYVKSGELYIKVDEEGRRIGNLSYCPTCIKELREGEMKTLHNSQFQCVKCGYKSKKQFDIPKIARKTY
ncbi:MAG: hypothetical protein WBL93_14220 [Lutisporaceae bacterium]